LLAFACFFRVLFGRPLPPEALKLTGTAAAGPAALPSSSPPEAPPPAAAPSTAPPPPAAAPQAGAVLLLSLLQREGRLVDFLMEDIADYKDDQVGAAVRAVHKGCRKVLAERFALKPVLEGTEGGPVRVEPGFDPGRIRLVGNVRGEPPFSGTLAHPGWRAAKVELPRVAGDGAAAAAGPAAGEIIAPAEVEL
jgi:hypothetical protein